MCAQFMIRANAKKLAARLGVILRDEDIDWAEHILPYGKAPVALRKGSERIMKGMQFSLLPAWSAERRVKFATHNARLLTKDEKTGKTTAIHEKPTWKSAFVARRCLVPMTHFIEPIYRGELAGNMVRFFEKSGELLVAAGIWEEWVSKKDGEVIDSFTIITDDPIPFVEKTGHDRSPVFLAESAFDEWLAPEKRDPRELIELLRSNKARLEFAVEPDRPLKPGWEKRA